MVSKYWLRDGFWDECKKGCFDKIEKNGKTFNLNNYLHGYCDIFIIKLFEFGKKHNVTYPICVIADNEGITHAFSWIENEYVDIDYFIDVRGITSEKDEFFEEFEDFFDYKSWFDGIYEPEEGEIYFFYNIEDYLDFMLKKFPREEWYFEQLDLLTESEEILKTFENNYLLPQWIVDEIIE